MTIRFLRDTTLHINNTLSSSYEDTYKENEIEYIDLTDETESHIHVQFNNGETSNLPREAIAFISHAKNK